MLFGYDGGGAAHAASGTLTIAWAQWKPADDLQQLAQEFTPRTGISVAVAVPNHSSTRKECASVTAKERMLCLS